MRLGEDQRGAGGAALRKLRARGSQEGVRRPVQARLSTEVTFRCHRSAPWGQSLGDQSSKGLLLADEPWGSRPGLLGSRLRYMGICCLGFPFQRKRNLRCVYSYKKKHKGFYWHSVLILPVILVERVRDCVTFSQG